MEVSVITMQCVRGDLIIISDPEKDCNTHTHTHIMIYGYIYI